MPLISNQVDGLYGGVNQQSAEQRLSTQAEEMINAFPTLDRGLLKRNPTQKLTLSDTVGFTEEIWSYAYDRGLGGREEEKYSINITSGNIEIVNVLTGKVYKDGSGLTFTGTAKDYLFPFTGVNGYAATTVKDVTFLVNKASIPKLKEPSVGTSAVVNMKTASIPLLGYTITGCFGTDTVPRLAPHAFSVGDIPPVYHGYTTITVDGNVIEISSVHDENAVAMDCDTFTNGSGILPYSGFIGKVISELTSTLSIDLYKIELGSDNILNIKRTDGTAIAVSIAIEGKTSGGATQVLTTADYFGTISYAAADETVYTPVGDYLKEGYVWIKSANPASAYTYSITVTDELSNTKTASGAHTTTTAAATALAATINADANFSAVAVGSVIKITGVNNLDTVDASDSWGNQASFGWAYKVQFNSDLPKNLGFSDAIVKITGSGTSDFATYWLTYTDSQWQETIDPLSLNEVDLTTLPHVLTRNGDDTFTFEPYDQWENSKVGDNESNPSASFIQTDVNKAPVIKDIFFFKNRLGFITERTVVLSEVGGYGNFWRTTTAAVLDSDYIDAVVDTTKVISLEYATYLEDAMMLFSDKAQFKLEGGRVLSPKDIQISQTSAYEINTDVRPLFMNDKVFFCAIRGEHTALMQYAVSSNNDSSEAIDISAHVQSYIPRDIIRLSGSSINNMLFLVSASANNTIFVYKYYDNANERVQSAWFKWTYNGKIYNAFSLGNNLNIMINRNQSIAATDWVVGTGIWDNSKLWDNSQVWVMSPDSLDRKDQFETTPIFPQDYLGDFLDDFTTVDNETIIPTIVRIGEWVASSRGSKDIRGHLKFKTVQISSEDGSEFNLLVEDINRNTSRTIKSKYTVNRKPMIYGDAKNIRISITNSDIIGFRINTVSYEGALTKRDSRR